MGNGLYGKNVQSCQMYNNFKQNALLENKFLKTDFSKMDCYKISL